ncbi:hypothetical protein NQ318_001446 [Aromia moschata]|uniref:VIT domain-containing protein n=1 Tax=Aromia moschata TaxID=1265417 RepID=A0AAV8YX54_9CUCU|nr:hypothetical protein NQ318_001446 [Aromia moschata]
MYLVPTIRYRRHHEEVPWTQRTQDKSMKTGANFGALQHLLDSFNRVVPVELFDPLLMPYNPRQVSYLHSDGSQVQDVAYRSVTIFSQDTWGNTRDTRFVLLCTLLAVIFTCENVLSAPAENSFVVTSTEASKENGKDGSTNVALLHPVTYEMDIKSDISNRFAKTLVTSKVKNSQTSAKETTFTVVLPEKAFISEFVMEIGGKKLQGAIASGQSAGHVAVSARDSNRFTVSINVEAEGKATFPINERKNEQYELVINIHPGQIVKKLNVEVSKLKIAFRLNPDL